MSRSSSSNSVLLKELKTEFAFSEKVSDAFLLSQELIAKLVIGLTLQRLQKRGVFEKADMESLIDNLEEHFPWMTEAELDFIGKTVFGYFYANIYKNPSMKLFIDVDLDEQYLLASITEQILERGLVRDKCLGRIRELDFEAQS